MGKTTFDGEQAGNPLFGWMPIFGDFEMRKEIEKQSDRHIRITDVSLVEQIDSIMEAPEYKSFNKVLNHALFYGLPILYEKVFGTVATEQPQEVQVPMQEPTDSENEADELLIEIVKLLKEIVLTGNLNKSMLSSIFRVCQYDHAGKTVSPDKLEAGQYGSTPDYLELSEIRGLKDIWGGQK